MSLYEDIINKQATIAQKQEEMAKMHAVLDGMQEYIFQEQGRLDDMIRSFGKHEETKFPKIGDEYYVMEDVGNTPTRYIYHNDGIDKFYLSRGLFGRTEEEVIFKDERLKVFAELERCGGVFKTRPSTQTQYTLALNQKNELRVQYEIGSPLGAKPNMWFPTKEQVQKAVDAIGKDRLLKYWFCVEVEE